MVTQQVGDVEYRDKIFKQKYVWHRCYSCGNERWVRGDRVKGDPLCLSCSAKVNAKTREFHRKNGRFSSHQNRDTLPKALRE